LRFRDQGLLLCECFVGRELAGLLPRRVRGEFLQDLADLEDVGLGVKRQIRTVDRIWRVWGKYLE
jgi:nuclear-control-of-ATPase protein 2